MANVLCHQYAMQHVLEVFRARHSLPVPTAFNIHDNLIHLVTETQAATAAKYFNIPALITWQLSKKYGRHLDCTKSDTEHERALLRKGHAKVDTDILSSTHGRSPGIKRGEKKSLKSSSLEKAATAVRKSEAVATLGNQRTAVNALRISTSKNDLMSDDFGGSPTRTPRRAEMIPTTKCPDSHNLGLRVSLDIQHHEKWLEALGMDKLNSSKERDVDGDELLDAGPSETDAKI